MSRAVKILIVVFCLSNGIGCIKGDAEVKLSREEQITIDTTFYKLRDSLNTLTDSICKLQYDAIFSNAVDSIKIERLKELEDIWK